MDKAIRLNIIALLAFCFLLLFIFPGMAHAQTQPEYQVVDIKNIPQTSPIYTDLIVHNLFHTASCLVLGQSGIGQPCLTYKLTTDAQGKMRGIPLLSEVNTSGGMVGGMGFVLQALYQNPPVNTNGYFAYLGNNFSPVKTVHAQVTGSGHDVLNPVISLWRVSRNIAYVIMVVVFVVIGIMIMFRQKLNPQTTITAQAAIPGLVIGLILITFSYFLAGLISDFAFIGTNIVGYYFSLAADKNNPVYDLTTKLVDSNVLTIMSKLANGALLTTTGPIYNTLGILFGPNGFQGFASVLVNFGIFLAAFQIVAPLGSAVGGLAAGTDPLLIPIYAAFGGLGAGAIAGLATAGAAPTILSVIFSIIIMIGIIYTMVKLILKLAKNYLSIIFYTIMSPFFFLAASLPGRQGLATDWIRNMLCNVLAFPAVAGVLYFANMLLGDISTGNPFPVTSTAPEIGGSYVFPLFGGMEIKFIRILLALTAVFATPAIPDIVCKAIGKIGQAGQLIGQEFGAGVKGGQQYMGRAQSGVGSAYKSGSQVGELFREKVELTNVSGRGYGTVKTGNSFNTFKTNPTAPTFTPLKFK